jgi:hypothetical protein
LLVDQFFMKNISDFFTFFFGFTLYFWCIDSEKPKSISQVIVSPS